MKKSELKSLAMQAQRSVIAMVNAINKSYNSDDNDELRALALAIGELQPGKLTVKSLNCMWDERYIYATDLVKELDLVEDEVYNTELAKWQKKYHVAPNGQIAIRYSSNYAGLVSLLYDRNSDRFKEEDAARKAKKKAAKLARKVSKSVEFLHSKGYIVLIDNAA